MVKTKASEWVEATNQKIECDDNVREIFQRQKNSQVNATRPRIVFLRDDFGDGCMIQRIEFGVGYHRGGLCIRVTNYYDSGSVQDSQEVPPLTQKEALKLADWINETFRPKGE